MRRLVLLAVLAPSLAGCGWFGGQQRSTVLSPTKPTPVPRWISLEQLPKRAYRGAALFYSSGCTACHTYAGTGSSNFGAPDLTAIGVHQLGIRLQITHLKCPPCVTPRVADAVLHVARKKAPAPARRFPRSLQGHALARIERCLGGGAQATEHRRRLLALASELCV